ncbi:hypothetical protein TA3x_001157 [Tundrisphaera sp. TA3]|uniref:hypothetical protein n=1 Tax=Tundrisphaera sp. TA3 TaxID=3435775 RepID=UPI003EBB769C
MIGSGAIVKSIARAADAAVRAAESRLASVAEALVGRRRKPALVPIPVRASGRSR